jgi:hypothetical protein
MNEFYFLIKFIPFWAVPCFLLFGEFGLIAKKKKKGKWAIFCGAMAIANLAMVAFYYWAGGPEKAARMTFDFVHYIAS